MISSQLTYVKFIPGMVINSSGVSNLGALYIYKKSDKPMVNNQPNMTTVAVKGYNANKYFLTH